MKIISRIKKELRDEKITQKELAKRMRISESNLCRYLSGQRTISLNVAIRLADYFEISLDELVGRK